VQNLQLQPKLHACINLQRPYITIKHLSLLAIYRYFYPFNDAGINKTGRPQAAN